MYYSMIEFEYLNQDNVNSVAEIEKNSLKTAWGEDELKKEINKENSIYIVIKDNNIVVGYIGAYFVLDELNITNIAIHPNFRQKGYGEKLMYKFIDSASEKNLSKIFLEVAENNFSAMKLYEKCGFEKIGTRKNFYDNKYDAILMKKE